MKKLIALLAAVAMVFSLSACIGSRGMSITVDNEVGYDGAYLYVSPTSESQWGDDLLEGHTLANGSSARVQLAPSQNNTYDIRMVDTDGDYWVFMGVTVANGATVVLNASLGDGVYAMVGNQRFEGDLQMQSGGSSGGGSAEGTISVMLQNNTSDSLWYGYVSDTNSTEWGDDLFGSSTCSAGSSLTMAVPAASGGIYDVRLDASGHDPSYQFQAVPLQDGSTIVMNADHSISVDGQSYQPAGGASGGGSAAPAPSSSTASATVTNNSSTGLYSGNISPTTAENWGSDVFGSSTLPTGSNLSVSFDSSADNTYDIRFRTSDETTFIWQNVTIPSGAAITLSDGQGGIILEVGGNAYMSSDSFVTGHSSLIGAAGSSGGSASNGVFTANFSVTNVGNETVWYMYCSSSNSSTWGPDQLGAHTIHPGDTMDFSIAGVDSTSNFDICFRDGSSNYWAIGNLDMSQITSINVNLDNQTVEVFAGSTSLGSGSLSSTTMNG